jgi:hypothetical protein
MKPTEYLFELINNSNISLLGYSYKDERIKDEIISKVSHYELPEIDSSFSMRSYIRDSKINSILDNESIKTTHYLLDISNFMLRRGDISRANLIKNSLRRITDELIDTDYKLLITCPIYNSPIEHGNEYIFSGGNYGLYIADFTGIIREDRIRIIKNKETESQIDIKI